MDFLSPAPWSTIKRTLRDAKRRHAVTAYLGTGASQLLPLRKGDRLIVNASDANARAGAVNPHELEAFYKGGVHVYHVANLHAKIYLADDTVLLGSANASKFSDDHLIEACISIEDKRLANEIKNWIDELSLIPLLANRIEYLKSIYKSPKWEHPKTSARQPSQQVANAWVTFVTSEDQSEELETYAEAVSERHDLDEDEIYMLRSTNYGNPSTFAKKARPGDEIFIIDHLDARTVYGPMRLIEKAQVTKEGPRNECMFAMGQSDLRIAFKRFRKLAERGQTSIAPSGRSTKRLKASAAKLIRDALDR